MANRKGETKRSTPRRQVGGKASTGSRTVDVGNVSHDEVIEAAQLKASGTDTTFVAAKSSSFQIRAERVTRHPDGFVETKYGKTLDFPGGRPCPVDDETLEDVKRILDGKHSDGAVNAQQFQRMAKLAGLRILYPALVPVPISTWDDLDADEVVKVAYAAGALASVGAIDSAIVCEKQRGKREHGAEPRDVVLADLDELRKKVANQKPPKPAKVAKQTVADDLPAETVTAPLLTESVEL